LGKREKGSLPKGRRALGKVERSQIRPFEETKTKPPPPVKRERMKNFPVKCPAMSNLRLTEKKKKNPYFIRGRWSRET